MVGKCISPVRIRLQTGKPRNASIKIRKVLGSKKREKSLEISRFLAVWLAKRLFPSLGSKLTCHHGWDSRTRTCKARVKVSCVAVTPYPIGIVRTPGKGAFVRSFGIITQRGFLVNIPDSHSGGRRSGQGYRTRGQYPRRENGCGGYVLRCARMLCGIFRASECVRVSRVLCSAKSRRRLRRGGFFADLQ